MALWSVDIEKFTAGEYWTNRYIVNQPDITLAQASGLGITNFERSVTSDSVTFTKYRVSDLNPETDLYVIVPLGNLGQRSAATPLLPLFNVVRVDFGTGSGRPSRKYLRGILVEGDITFNTISTDLITLINTNYADPLVAANAYVDVDGEEIINRAVYSNVAMRQLRRGSRRRTEPILP
jgi:hypothetical protein